MFNGTEGKKLAAFYRVYVLRSMYTYTNYTKLAARALCSGHGVQDRINLDISHDAKIILKYEENIQIDVIVDKIYIVHANNGKSPKKRFVELYSK